jgi:hypothetical protein
MRSKNSSSQVTLRAASPARARSRRGATKEVIGSFDAFGGAWVSGLVATAGEDGFDEIVRHVVWEIRLVCGERLPSEIDRRAVVREVSVAVRTAAHVSLELRRHVGRQFTGQVFADELGEFATGHCGATSQ